MSKQALKLTGFILAILVIVIMVPGFVLTLIGLKSIAGVTTIGAVSGMTGTLTSGWRIGLRVSVATGIAAGLAILAVGNPIIAFLVFALIGIAVGFTGSFGNWSAYVMVPIAAGFLLGEDPTVFPNRWVDAGVIAVVFAAAGCFAVLVSHAAARGKHRSDVDPLARARALAFGALLGLLLGIGAVILVTFDLGHTGSWVILTVTIIVQPYLQDGFTKALHRASGTILGFFIAIGISVSMDVPALLYAMSALAIALALYAMVGAKPYWLYATALTVGIVLLEGAGTSVITTAQQRLIATAIGAAISLIAMALLQPFVSRAAKQAGRTHY